MAVAFGVPEKIAETHPGMKMTDFHARRLLMFLGTDLKGDSFTLNPMSGVPGEYYTTNRKEDLLNLCRELIQEKELELT